MTIFRQMFRPEPESPQAWHYRFVLYAQATTYRHVPTGSPATVILGWVMRRSVEHFDLGPWRFHRYEYRIGVPATTVT